MARTAADRAPHNPAPSRQGAAGFRTSLGCATRTRCRRWVGSGGGGRATKGGQHHAVRVVRRAAVAERERDVVRRHAGPRRPLVRAVVRPLGGHRRRQAGALRWQSAARCTLTLSNSGSASTPPRGFHLRRRSGAGAWRRRCRRARRRLPAAGRAAGCAPTAGTATRLQGNPLDNLRSIRVSAFVNTTTGFAWTVRTAKVEQGDVRRAVGEQRLQGVVRVQRACTGHRR